MDDSNHLQSPQKWTLKDTIKEIWDLSKGPLEILIAGGLTYGLYKATSGEDIGAFLKYSTRIVGTIAGLGLAADGVETTIFYGRLYRAIHNNLNRYNSEISE
jgi:hypothetical protein